MVRITMNAEQREQFLAADGAVELCDASGEILGRAIAKTTGEASSMKGWIELIPEPSSEEYQRRRDSTEPGIPAEEFLARLKDRL